nr:reverse transcriptase domain-containing protein [Tanacetum cinerariifolium]
MTINIRSDRYFFVFLTLNPVKEKPTKSTPLQKADKGKVIKARTVKSSLQLVDEPDEEQDQPEAVPESQDDTSANVVRETSSPADAKTGVDTDKEHTDVLDEGQAGSDPGKTLESRPPPDDDKMDEDQARSDPGKSHVALAGPNPEPMHDDFVATVYPKVHEILKFLADERFFNEKSTKDDLGKQNVNTKVVSMVTSLIHQASTSVPPLSTSIIDLSPLKSAASPLSESFNATTIETTTTTLPLPPPPQQQSITDLKLDAHVMGLEKKFADFEQKIQTLDNATQNLGSRIKTASSSIVLSLENIIPPIDLPEAENNWADALAKSYQDPEKNKLLSKTGDMGSFIKWFSKRIGKKKLSKSDLEGPAFKVVKSFHENIISLQFQIEECQRLLTDQVDLVIPEGHRLVLNVSKPLPLGGPPVRSHMRILSVISIKTFERYGYAFLRETVIRRADYNEYNISEADFKNLHLIDFEDMYLLYLQGKLNHLPGLDKVYFYNAINLWIRNIVIRQRVGDLQLGNIRVIPKYHGEDGNLARANIKQALSSQIPSRLDGASRTWIEKEPPNSNTTWDDLVSKNKPQVSSSIGNSSQNDTIIAPTKQVEALSKHIASMQKPMHSIQESCETCGGPHHYFECQATSSFTEGDVYAVTRNYNMGVPPLFLSSSKEVEREPEPTMDQPPILHPSRLNKDKLQDKFDIQIHKFLQMFKKLHFNISLLEALALMPKYAKILKDLLTNKEKLLEMANTPLNENCSVVILKKLPEKLGDPGKFLIPCDFIDVHREELILRVGDEKLTFKVDSTLKYSHGKESINMIDIFNTTCEDHFHKVLNFQKSIHPLSGNPTPSSDLVEAFCFDINHQEEKSSGSTTSQSDHSLPDYEAFCFDIDHHEEKSSSSTISYFDLSPFEYESFYFDLLTDPPPIVERSNSHHEEFADEVAHIISLQSYSQNSKAYIILNKHTMKIKESLNVTFDETPPPSKTSPLVDDDLDKEEAIKVTEKKNLENDIEDEL